MARGYKVAKRRFLKTIEEARAAGQMTQDLEREAEFVRCAFDQYGLNRHSQGREFAKANLDQRLAEFGVKFAVQNGTV